MYIATPDLHGMHTNVLWWQDKLLLYTRSTHAVVMQVSTGSPSMHTCIHILILIHSDTHTNCTEKLSSVEKACFLNTGS